MALRKGNLRVAVALLGRTATFPAALEDFHMRLSHTVAFAATLALPLLAGCTVNNPPSQPVVVQQQPAAVIAAPPVVLQRY